MHNYSRAYNNFFGVMIWICMQWNQCLLILLLNVSCLFCFSLCQVVDYLIDPFVAGTNAADPESLSVSLYDCFGINMNKKQTRPSLQWGKEKDEKLDPYMIMTCTWHLTHKGHDKGKAKEAIAAYSMLQLFYIIFRWCHWIFDFDKLFLWAMTSSCIDLTSFYKFF